MIVLTHPATGHEIRVDEESLDFWKAAGFREAEQKPAKRAAKKAAPSSKSSE